MSDAGYVTPHWRFCPAKKDPDRTCHCARRWVPPETFPSVDLEKMTQDIKDSGVAKLKLAGKLKEHPRFGLILAPESLAR